MNDKMSLLDGKAEKLLYLTKWNCKKMCDAYVMESSGLMSSEEK